MCEAECGELANGIHALTEAYFPHNWLAAMAVTASTNNEKSENNNVPASGGCEALALAEQKKKIDITM